MIGISAEVMSSFQFGDLPADFESDLIINIDPSTEKTQTLSAQSLLQLLNDTEMLSYTEANVFRTFPGISCYTTQRPFI